MDDLKKVIHGNQERYLDFLGKLVSFDTSVIRHGEDGQEGAAQMYLADFLESLGCEVDIQAITRATAMQEGLMWWEHTEVRAEGNP